MSAVSWQQGDLLLNVYLQPRASRDQIVGLYGNELKVAITAPPIDGKANAHLSQFLAKIFKVPKSNIYLVKGELGRHKQIRIIAPKIIPAAIGDLLE